MNASHSSVDLFSFSVGYTLSRKSWRLPLSLLHSCSRTVS